MGREHKIALILGFSVVLVVAVLVSDHLSRAQRDRIADGTAVAVNLPPAPSAVPPPRREEEEGGATLLARGEPGWPVRRRESAAEPMTWPAPEPAPELAPEPASEQSRQRESAGASAPPETPEPTPQPAIIAIGPTAAKQPVVEAPDRSALSDFARRVGSLIASGEAEVMAMPARGSSRARPLPPPEPAPSSYRVEPGDTLSEIAQRTLGSASRWREIAALNPDLVNDRGHVRVGTTLRLPVENDRSNAAAATPRVHRVAPGDTLRGIAREALGDPDRYREILELNGLSADDARRLAVGTELRLPG